MLAGMDNTSALQTIRVAAQHRVGYLRWLADHLTEPKYSGMLPIGREDIRKAAAVELRLLAAQEDET